MTIFLIAIIKLYQRLISPLFGSRCRFHPSCSQYAVESLYRHGSVKGSGLAMLRLLKCGPWSEGGFDPVPTIEAASDE